MLARHFRLTKHKDILAVVRYGRRLNSLYVRIFYRAKTVQPQTYSRIACVVGRHVHTSAVIRHRYQRWLREIASSMLSQYTQPHDMVWVAKKEIINVTKLSELNQNLQQTLRKLKKPTKKEFFARM